jgi:hypothetical protein
MQINSIEQKKTKLLEKYNTKLTILTILYSILSLIDLELIKILYL